MNPWHPLPSSILSFAEQTPGTVLLENSRPVSSSISRLFTGSVRHIEAREFSELPALFAQIEDAIRQGYFAAGYFAYECGQYFEPTAALNRRRDTDLLAWFGIYEHCIRFDHTTGTFLDKESLAESQLAGPNFGRGLNDRADEPTAALDGIHFALSEEEFAERISQIHNWIRAGEVYQLNFTFPLRTQINEPPATLYDRLRAAQPVDHGAFLHYQSGRYILSLSPELFFRIDQHGSTRRITTQPMKGTARRGRTVAEDREIAASLRNDPKNRAENVMIVDLIRNDLGRLCSYGSVRVEKLFEVVRYPTLWQMTSTITGELCPDVDFEQILRALFPCGSITGAPKVRAMQLLAQIEEEPRGIYTGAIGFFSREQTVFNVAIRTLTLEQGTVTMGIGGGIIIDSDPAAEYRECRLKAEFLTRPSERFSLIETMLWNGEFPMLEQHLDRVEDSADYFAFPCDRTAIRAALLAAADLFHDKHPRKIRLLLDADGTHHLESEILRDANGGGSARVCIAAQRTDPADRFLFHKTTHRALYTDAFAAASDAGFDDVLFLNSRGEVTEGAISNLFIERSGRWYTPPLACGVLPGVFRRHMLETRSNIEEKVLTINDLKAADSVHLSNAVRGLRLVTIDFQFNQETA